MVLVAVQRNMMRWGRKDKVYPSFSSFACVPVIKASIPIVAPRSPMLNSPCTLSFYCHLLRTTHGCDYHCVNVPQTQNNIARVPVKSMWQAWGCVFFSNTELAEMSFEFLHLRIIVFTVVVCISGIPLSSRESVYLSTTFSGHRKISDFLLLTAPSRLSSSPLLHTTSTPCRWCVGLQDSAQYPGQIDDL